MKLRPLSTCLLLSGLLTSQAAYTEEATYTLTPFGQLGISQKEQKFSQLLDQGLSFYMLRAGGGFTFDRFYVAAYGDWSISDADVSEEEETGSASRAEYDLTFGFRPIDPLTLFAGYKTGKTKIDFTPRNNDEVPTAFNFRDTYKETGPYLGASYSFIFEQAGSLSFSLAYAFLNAENSIGVKPDDSGESEENEFDDISGNFENDADGFSAGVTWLMPLANNLNYFATIRYQRYDQDIATPSGNQSIAEEYTELGMGLMQQF